MHRFPDIHRAGSEAVLHSAGRTQSDFGGKLDTRPRSKSTSVAGGLGDGLRHDPAVFYLLRPVSQLAVTSLVSLAAAWHLRGRKRSAVLLGVWCVVEAVRLALFRRAQRILRGSVLRAPASRRGVAALSHTASDHRLSGRRSASQRDDGDQTRNHVALCRHLRDALLRGHRFEVHLRCHLSRRGLKDDFHSWLWLFHGVLSNGGSSAVRSAGMDELRSLAGACSGSGVVDRNAEPPTASLWGLGGVDRALPRPLLVDVGFEVARAVLAINLRGAGFTARRAFVMVANAEVEFLVWIHPGPRQTTVPCVFLHGAGMGAVIYTPLLAHVAKYRRVIAIEVPGVSFGQVSEAGPAAVLDGIPEVVRSTLGSKCVYDVVGHSAGGWFTNVLLRAVRRGALHAPRRVVIMESPCVVPAFLRCYLMCVTDVRDSVTVPYTPDRKATAWLSRIGGCMVGILFCKEIWHLHCLQCGFMADELVILPETVLSLPDTELLFMFNERDGFTNSQESFAYVNDMLAAPHVRAVLLPEAGHGTFLVFRSEWKPTVSVLDAFLQQGHARDSK